MRNFEGNYGDDDRWGIDDEIRDSWLEEEPPVDDEHAEERLAPDEYSDPSDIDDEVDPIERLNDDDDEDLLRAA